MTQTPAPTLLKKTLNIAAKPRPWRLGDIMDTRKLRVQLTAAALDNLGHEAATRKRMLELLHTALFRGRMIAQERLQQGADGLDTARLLAAVQDEVIHALYDFTTTHVFRASNPTEGERLAVLATGGYGRAVLAPSSDIDLLFLRQYKASPWAESVIEFMLYALWDMGLKVGHAFRTIDNCISLAKEDVTIKTSLLDTRFLFGDEGLAKELETQFHEQCVVDQDTQFIADKLEERDHRHARQGNTRYVVEPNVKEGKGGLRDLQTLYWISKHVNGGKALEDVMKSGALTKHEYRMFIRDARFFWTVRCHLHYITGRAEERVSFDLQPELASRMNYQDRGGQLGVERFMKRYFLAAKNVGGLSRILSAKLEAEQKKVPRGIRRFLPQAAPKPIEDTGFTLDTGRLSIAAPTLFETQPKKILELFVMANQQGVDIHPNAMAAASRAIKSFRPAMRKDSEARALFLSCLLDTKEPAKTLRLMNETGTLGRFLPEFGGIVAQTQFNMYHHFTVDEHTIRAVEIMSDIEHGRSEDHPHAMILFQEITHRRALYLAMLLHDTGKGKGDQQIEGMRTARAACRRLGLPKDEIDLVAWLVGNHLEMSETAQKRDIGDPKTVADFAELVGSAERLRLLHILTVADITAVGPKVWNGWKGQLLTDLNHNTAAALSEGRTNEDAVERELTARAESRRTELENLVGTLPVVMAQMEPAYWTGFDFETLVQHAKIMAQKGTEIVSLKLREDKGAVTLLVAGKDRIGLFAELAGTLAAYGANIIAAQIFTSKDKRILDVFRLQDRKGNPFAGGDARSLERLQTALEDVLSSKPYTAANLTPERQLREAAFLVEPSVEIDAQASTRFTVIDITARDRAGLLAEISSTLAAQKLSIHSAHVGSYGERVFDAFYVQTRNGHKLTNQKAKETLRKHLMAVLTRDDLAGPKTPAHDLARARPADSF